MEVRPSEGPPVPLSPQARQDAVTRMATQRFDLVVVGGGVTGVGVALDAVTRGLTVALVEARDYAAGTSSRSSKLIHGGLRYLEHLNFGLVREALRERALLLDRLCPHLVHPVRFLYPLTHRGWERLYVGAGIALYDVLGGGRGDSLRRHRHLSRTAALRAMPALRPDALVGAIAYDDGQVDDARHTVMVARTAVERGALLASSVRATGLLERDGRACGITARDLETGQELTVRARAVVYATGVFTSALPGLDPGLSVTASKGVHLVVPWDRIASRDVGTGLITKTATSVLFVIPWHGSHWLIGTTDTAWALDLAHPAASARDISYLLAQVNRVLVDPLTENDVVGVYAGLRPLLAGESDATSKLSREHAVVTPAPGLTVVAGGKYTTYRVMARDTVDVATAGWSVPASGTAEVPLVGAEGYAELWRDRAALADHQGLEIARVEALLHRYGTLIHELLATTADRPDLRAPLASAPGYLRAEASYAVTHEGALHLDDILTRRTRISIETLDRGVDAAQEIADLVAHPLGWSPADLDREVEHYRMRVAAERQSQEQPDDLTADAARLGARDVRLTPDHIRASDPAGVWPGGCLQ